MSTVERVFPITVRAHHTRERGTVRSALEALSGQSELISVRFVQPLTLHQSDPISAAASHQHLLKEKETTNGEDYRQNRKLKNPTEKMFRMRAH